MTKLPQLLILAGGLATRLKPISEKFPKSLITINGEPFIFHQLNQVRKRGISEVVICIGYKGDQIKKAVGNGSKFGLDITYCEESENNLLGTGGAVLNALKELDDHFFIMYGDSWLNINFKKLYLKFLESQKSAVMSIIKNDNRWDKSNILFNRGKIIEYYKDSASENLKHIDYGVSIIKKRIFLEKIYGLKFDLEKVFSKLVNNKDLDAFLVYDRFYQIGTIEGIKETSKNLKKYI